MQFISLSITIFAYVRNSFIFVCFDSLHNNVIITPYFIIINESETRSTSYLKKQCNISFHYENSKLHHCATLPFLNDRKGDFQFTKLYSQLFFYKIIYLHACVCTKWKWKLKYFKWKVVYLIVFMHYTLTFQFTRNVRKSSTSPMYHSFFRKYCSKIHKPGTRQGKFPVIRT